MQFQADMLGAKVERPRIIETTALGAAYLAGLGVGFWKMSDIENGWQLDRSFHPNMEEQARKRKYAGWEKAVKRCMAWEE
jgi:glycerol kinase